jgi:DNA modification methylase
MVGSGTTLIEAKLLNRHALGIDINPEAVELSNTAFNLILRIQLSKKQY